MKIKTLLTSIFFLAFSAVAVCAGSFSLALLCRMVARAWKLGWLMFSILMIGCSVTLLPATPVWFPLVGITGSANNRDITVIPDVATNVLTYGGNLVSLQTLLIHPVRGNATNELLPWGYTMRVDGWPRSAHFVVPQTTNVVNVTSLITNAVAIGSPVSFWNGYTGTVTNLAVAGFSTTNLTSLSLAGITNAGYATNYYPAPFLHYGTFGFTNAFTNATLGVGLNIDDNYGVIEWNVFKNTGSGYLLLYYSTVAMDQPLPPSGSWTSYADNSTKNFSFTTIYTTTNTSRYNLTTFINGVCITNIFK